jgi:hypothetical protein
MIRQSHTTYNMTSMCEYGLHHVPRPKRLSSQGGYWYGVGRHRCTFLQQGAIDVPLGFTAPFSTQVSIANLLVLPASSRELYGGFVLVDLYCSQHLAPVPLQQ